MLDTNTVSYILKGSSSAARNRLASLDPDDVACVSAITEGEIRYGLAKISASPRRISAVDWFLARLRILPWGRDEAGAYGLLRAKQQMEGKTLESMDLLIAAHAVSTGAVLVTGDKVFAHVFASLLTENWATDLQS